MRKAHCIFLFLFAGMFAEAFSQTPAPLPVAKDSFIVISHRGNHLRVPENTLAAIEEAVRAGANYVELDLRTTRDSFLVLSHDGTIDRMTDGKGRVKDLTLAEIKKLRVTSPVKTDKKVYRVPEFKDVLKYCKGRINIYLDFKDADPVETYRQIREAGMEKQVVVYLNSAGQYRPWRKVAPAMPLMTGVPDNIKTPEQLDMLLGQFQIEVVDNLYDPAMQAVARRHGVSLWLDVQSQEEGPAVWESFLRKDIQGVQTDHPDSLIQFLVRNKWRNGIPGGRPVAAVKPSPVSDYRTMKDIPYGSGDKDQYLDAYIPGNVDNARVIVYIHGGGWTGGDKKELPKPVIDELVGRKGYIVVSMNYRLVQGGKNIFPAQIDDIRSLLSFLSEHAGRYNYNGKEFALMGGSAGGHLAMLYAYGYDSARQIRTVVDFWGPTDLSDKAFRSVNKEADTKVANLLGAADMDAPVCRDASPIYRLTGATGVPTILFHGEEDPLVPVSQAEKLYKKLQSLQIPAQLELYPHEKHGVGGEAAMDVYSKTLAWLDKYYPAKP